MYYEKRGVSYEEYAFDQGRKIRNPEKLASFKRHIPQRVRKFKAVFCDAKNFLNRGKVLCLGARTGCEIKGAQLAGFKGSQGIDLYPIGSNVTKGDWHNIPFPANSFDNVYTNSIDHCYDLVSLVKEVRRVLKPGGKFFCQTSKHQRLDTKDDRDWYMKHSMNFLFWERGRDLVDAFSEYGFVLVREWEYGKWESFVLKVDK